MAGRFLLVCTLMCGHGQWYNMSMDLTTLYGFHHGDGITDLIGGTHGDLWFITTIITTGGPTRRITHIAIRHVSSMRTIFTGRIEQLRSSSTIIIDTR